MLYRDPGELRRAVSSFCGIRVLSRTSRSRRTTTPASWSSAALGPTRSSPTPTCFCSIRVWDHRAIDAIESGDQRELSCGYHYVPDMRAGTHRGEHFDGIMREIRGDHVALVREGRAGEDVRII